MSDDSLPEAILSQEEEEKLEFLDEWEKFRAIQQHSDRYTRRSLLLRLINKYDLGPGSHWYQTPLPNSERIIQTPFDKALKQLRELAALEGLEKVQDSSYLSIQILEEPLQLSTMNIFFSALTDLSTKCWLLSQSRFADLQTYALTHDEQFVKEAGVTIGKMSHNSPLNGEFKISASDIARSLGVAIDGIAQARQRFDLKDLEIVEKIQQLEQAKQQAEQQLEQVKQQATQEKEQSALEREKKLLEVEQQRLQIFEQRLDLQKKAILSAMEIAANIVDTLMPDLDEEARAMAMQLQLPSILRLQQIPLTLPSLQNEKTNQK